MTFAANALNPNHEIDEQQRAVVRGEEPPVLPEQSVCSGSGLNWKFGHDYLRALTACFPAN